MLKVIPRVGSNVKEEREEGKEEKKEEEEAASLRVRCMKDSR